MRIPLQFVNAALAAAMLLAPAACGWKADGGARLDQLYHPDLGPKDAVADVPADVPAEAVADAPPEAAGDEGGFDLSPGDVPTSSLAGLWAIRVEQKGELTPIIETLPITTPDYFLAEVDAGATAMHLVFCNEIPVVDTSASADPSLQFITRTPKALQDALAKVPVDLALADSGASLPAQKVVWTWGLQNVGETDAMPTRKDLSDARIVDQDQDGNPGVTVEVAGAMEGKRYMVKRAVWNLSAGTLSQDGLTMSGTLTFALDEEPLGADPSALAQKTPITPKDGSTFTMRRVGEMACDGLLAHLDEVFAP